MRRPPTVWLREDHCAVEGQHGSTGEHLHCEEPGVGGGAGLRASGWYPWHGRARMATGKAEVHFIFACTKKEREKNE